MSDLKVHRTEELIVLYNALGKIRGSLIDEIWYRQAIAMGMGGPAEDQCVDPDGDQPEVDGAGFERTTW